MPIVVLRVKRNRDAAFRAPNQDAVDAVGAPTHRRADEEDEESAAAAPPRRRDDGTLPSLEKRVHAGENAQQGAPLRGAVPSSLRFSAKDLPHDLAFRRTDRQRIEQLLQRTAAKASTRVGPVIHGPTKVRTLDPPNNANDGATDARHFLATASDSLLASAATATAPAPARLSSTTSAVRRASERRAAVRCERLWVSRGGHLCLDAIADDDNADDDDVSYYVCTGGGVDDDSDSFAEWLRHRVLTTHTDSWPTTCLDAASPLEEGGLSATLDFGGFGGEPEGFTHDALLAEERFAEACRRWDDEHDSNDEDNPDFEYGGVDEDEHLRSDDESESDQEDADTDNEDAASGESSSGDEACNRTKAARQANWEARFAALAIRARRRRAGSSDEDSRGSGCGSDDDEYDTHCDTPNRDDFDLSS